MGIFDLLKGWMNDADEKLDSNPVVIRERIRKLTADLNTLNGDLAEQKAKLNQLNNQKANFESDIARYTTGAKKALEAGDEALARDALTEKQRIAKEMDALLPQIEILQNLVAQLEDAQKKMQVIKADAEQSLSGLEAKQKLTKVAEEAVSLSEKYGSGSNIDLGKINAKEDIRLDVAMQKLAATGHQEKDLDSRLSSLDGGNSIDTELQRLKDELK